jgi:hypothetical protein
MPEELKYRLWLIVTPDEIPLPVRAGGLGLPGGPKVIIRVKAAFPMHPRPDSADYVVLNTTKRASNEPFDLSDLIGAPAVAVPEGLATNAFTAGPQTFFGVAVYDLLHNYWLHFCSRSCRFFLARVISGANRRSSY